MLVANNLTAIANKITPNILRIILIPLAPINRSIFEDVFNTAYIKITFNKTAIIIF